MDNFTEQTLNLGRFGEMLTALSEMGTGSGSRGASDDGEVNAVFVFCVSGRWSFSGGQ